MHKQNPIQVNIHYQTCNKGKAIRYTTPVNSKLKFYISMKCSMQP